MGTYRVFWIRLRPLLAWLGVEMCCRAGDATRFRILTYRNIHNVEWLSHRPPERHTLHHLSTSGYQTHCTHARTSCRDRLSSRVHRSHWESAIRTQGVNIRCSGTAAPACMPLLLHLGTRFELFRTETDRALVVRQLLDQVSRQAPNGDQRLKGESIWSVIGAVFIFLISRVT